MLRPNFPTPLPNPAPVVRLTTQSKKNSCSEIVLSLEQVPQSQNPYPWLTNFIVEGGELVIPGHPVENVIPLEEDQYMFFQTCVPDEKFHRHYHNIQISVEPIEPKSTCDPDLFVSATRPHPTAVDSTWLSKSIGGETIILPSNHADFPPGTRTLYIGVRSRKDKCIFSISVDIKDRKNKFGNLRLRRDDYAGLHDMEHETWKAFD